MPKRFCYSTPMLAIAVAFSGLLLAMPVHAFQVTGSAGTQLEATEIARFDEPWAMTFLPDGSALVTEKRGVLKHLRTDGTSVDVAGMWEVAYGGQGGLGDVVLHPDFAQNNLVYISYAEANAGGRRGAVVVRAVLDTSGERPRLRRVQRIWEQRPKVSGGGHYSHRIAFDGAGHIFISSGDRQKQTPAQDMRSSLGKLIRLRDDGSIPADNPFQSDGNRARTYWSIGHRNMLGLAFAPDGRLWSHEMGPRHGDEINLIARGDNYGWPIVSDGDNYSGVPIPDHDTRPEFNAPERSWVPSIAPSGLIIYSGNQFPNFQGDALLGGLRSMALIHVNIEGEAAEEAERFEWGARVREVEQGPDGAIYVLEDGPDGRLLRFNPA